MANDQKFNSRYTGEEMENAFAVALAIANHSGIPRGTGNGSIQILILDTDKLSDNRERIPSSLAVLKAIDASRDSANTAAEEAGKQAAAAQSAATAANTAAALANQAKTDAETAASDAASAAEVANTAADTAQARAAAAEEAAEAATTAALGADAARDTANTAADAANQAAAAARAVVDTVAPDVNLLKSDMAAILSGTKENARFHLGLYRDENGELCELEEE